MRVEQYVYFAVYSSEVPAVEIAERLRLQPDSTMVRGSKDPGRPLPLQHSWAVETQHRDSRLDDQIEEVLAHVRPVEAALIELLPALGSDGGCVLRIVRHLNDRDAPERETQLLGFALGEDALQLLSRLDAFVDVDEYDYALGDG